MGPSPGALFLCSSCIVSIMPTKIAQTFNTFFLPSSAEGLHWRFSVYKPNGSPAVVCASEGTLEHQNGVNFFTVTMHRGRSVRRPLAGRATLKAVSEALSEVLETLAIDGAITPEDEQKGLRLAYGR